MKQALPRRGFLRLLGGAFAAGPQAAKAAADMTVADLELRGMGVMRGALSGIDRAEDAQSDAVVGWRRADWARHRLKELARLGKLDASMRKSRFYLDGLEPSVASLRSVALSAKIRMSRDMAFARSEEQERSYLEGIIKGWWD